MGVAAGGSGGAHPPPPPPVLELDVWLLLGETQQLWKSRRKIGTCPSPTQEAQLQSVLGHLASRQGLQVSNKQVFVDFVPWP